MLTTLRFSKSQLPATREARLRYREGHASREARGEGLFQLRVDIHKLKIKRS